MCGSMVDIQSTAAEIRRRKKKERKKSQGKKIIVCPITSGDHNKIQDENIYGLSYYIGRP